MILACAWILTVLLGSPLWRRVTVTAAALGAGALAVVVNLLAAGGIGISAVALMLWLLIALGLNLRDDRPCSRLRDADGRLAAFGLAAVWAALLGIFVGAISPFWESEEAIREALSLLVRGRTVIAIAHRLATLRNFDRVVMLQGGQILEDGPPDVLLRGRGPYRELVTREMGRLAVHAA